MRVGDVDADRPPGRGPRHRQRRGDAADRRPRLGPGLEQPRRDDLEGGPGEHGRARRRAGRLGAGPGLVDAGDRGHSGRGRRSHPAPRGALRRRAGGRRPARGARRRRPHGRARASGSPRGRAGASSSSSTAARSSRRPSSWSRSGAGRAAPAIGLESVEVEPGEGGFVETDDRLRVGGREWLYAVGDVNGRALFTHMGKYQAWVAAENALGHEVEAIAEAIGSPRVTFTDPQVAAVGKTLEQAADAGIDASAVDVPTDGTAGASFYGKGTGGTARIVVDEGAGHDRRRHLHRLRDRRLPPGGDDRDRRRGPARAAAPRGRRVSDPQRDLAQAARGLRSSRRFG